MATSLVDLPSAGELHETDRLWLADMTAPAGSRDQSTTLFDLMLYVAEWVLVGFGEDPGVDDDEAAGYFASLLGFQFESGRLWYCRDASEGAAVWELVPLPGEIPRGVTGDRPDGAGSGFARLFFDSTLGKVIVHDGSAWVNLDGSSL